MASLGAEYSHLMTVFIILPKCETEEQEKVVAGISKSMSVLTAVNGLMSFLTV